MKRFPNNRAVVEGFYADVQPNGEASNIFFEGPVLYSYGHHFPMAVRIPGNRYIVNGDKYSITTGKHQSHVFQVIPNSKRVEIPFSALMAMLGMRNDTIDQQDLVNMLVNGTIELIDWENDRYVDTGQISVKTGEPIMEHYLGACLFKYKRLVGIEETTRYLISAIDESGTNGGLFFLTELKEPAETVMEAFEQMKPDDVKEAEAKGVEVKRQGEFFFIKSPNDFDRKENPIHKDFANRVEKNYCLRHRAEHGWRDSQNHVASEGFCDDSYGAQFVRGIVKHDRGQHKQLKLYEDVKEKGWWQVLEAVYMQSWGASGNVD